jgi:hypothetical protein
MYSVLVSIAKGGFSPCSFYFIFHYVLIKIYLSNLYPLERSCFVLSDGVLDFYYIFFPQKYFFSQNVLNSVHRALWEPKAEKKSPDSLSLWW